MKENKRELNFLFRSLADFHFFFSSLVFVYDMAFLLIKGVNVLLVPTFWADLHFGLKIDFIPIVIPKKKKKNRFYFSPCR